MVSSVEKSKIGKGEKNTGGGGMILNMAVKAGITKKETFEQRAGRAKGESCIDFWEREFQVETTARERAYSNAR